MGKVIAVCISEKKGSGKKPCGRALFFEEHGIQGDAHAGKWHRQVSILSLEKIEAFRARGAAVDFGDFGENLVVEGIDFSSLAVGTVFKCAGVTLRMTQIGKLCHKHCAIFEKVGDCIMPREGVFAEVLSGGEIKIGDEFLIEPESRPET